MIPKNQVRSRNTIEQAEHEEAANARRVMLVGPTGLDNSASNPLYVQLTDGSVNIGTVHAQLEMFITHKDNDPDAGDVHSSLRVGDGVTEAGVTLANELKVSDADTHSALADLSNKFIYSEVLIDNETITSSGSENGTIDSPYKEVVLVIRIDGPVTGATPTIQFTVQDVDPANGNLTGNSTSTSVFTSAITSMYITHYTATGVVRLIWNVGGGSPSFGGVYASLTRMAAHNVLPAGAATSANQLTEIASLASIDLKVATAAKQDIGNASLSSIDSKVSTEAKQDIQITNQNTLNTRIGDLTESAPASDTASSGLNGRLQRIAQRLTSLIALFFSQGSTTSGQVGPLVQGAVTTFEPTYTTAQTNPLSLTTSGRLRTESVGNVANASIDSGNPVKIGGVFNTTAPSFSDGQRGDLQLDKVGAALVNVEGQKRTYSASINSLVLAALATDFFSITGADGTIVRLESISLTGESNANQVPEIILLKRSTANTGGTSTTLTAVPHDSADAAATATVRAYTANPATLGTLVGSLRSYDMFLSGSNSNEPQILSIEFKEKSGKSPRLNSANEVLALNFSGVTIAGANFAINITWTEE